MTPSSGDRANVKYKWNAPIGVEEHKLNAQLSTFILKNTQAVMLMNWILFSFSL